jgi:hypothetical protein
VIVCATTLGFPPATDRSIPLRPAGPGRNIEGCNCRIPSTSHKAAKPSWSLRRVSGVDHPDRSSILVDSMCRPYYYSV